MTGLFFIFAPNPVYFVISIASLGHLIPILLSSNWLRVIMFLLFLLGLIAVLAPGFNAFIRYSTPILFLGVLLIRFDKKLG